MTQQWQEQGERGTALGMAILVAVARFMGRSAAMLLLAFITLYFFVFGRSARRHSRDYLRRILRRPPRLIEVWRHIHTFAVVALDRLFLLMQRGGLKVEVRQTELVLQTAQAGGALLVVSHVGSFEAMRVPGTREAQLPLAILMDRAQGARYTAIMERVAPDLAAQVIDAGNAGPALVLQLAQTLKQGALVGVMADRVRGDEPTTTVDFLGGTARLPLAPWQLALVLKCPVLLGFATYHGKGCYRAEFELLSPGGATVARGNRSEQAKAMAQAYATRLESKLQAAPYNWFNFYDFWETP